ncbi:MAG: PhzF family phenazine biosynthesis protein [Candidatus Thorarchaeota archaeon]|jgi:trans-2,3-dihydro-3-hydroxyanthranilate isomerase
MREFPYVQTSVFVDDRQSFGGNQLATYWDSSVNLSLTQEEMQGMALEMNFSESTFLVEPTTKGCISKVRIFTPASEIPFAGHPTLGTAFVLKHKQILNPEKKTALLELEVGPIRVDFLDDYNVRMIQPEPSFEKPIEDAKKVAEAIGLTLSDVDQDNPVQVVSTGNPFLIVPIKNISAVKKAAPVPSLFRPNLADLSTMQISIFSTETIFLDSHVHARVFAPELGVVEDPATGSAAGPLGAYLEKHKILRNHQLGDPINIEQGYEMERPSKLVARVPHESMSEVHVSGKVRLIAEGTFYLP